jgi:FdhE protein
MVCEGGRPRGAKDRKIVASTSDQLRSLREWEAREGQIPEAVSLYRKLLDVQAGAESCFKPPAVELNASVIAEKAEAGEPLLTFDEIAIDWALFEDLFAKVSNLLAVSADNSKDVKALVRNWFDGPASGTSDNEVLDVAIHASLKPFLAGRREALIKAVDQEAWRRGYCPICGGIPDFAFLHAERAERWLVCSRCDAEWLFQRLECSFCGNHDQNTLAFFADEKEQYRLYVCEKCKRYLKAIDLRRSNSKAFSPVERLLTSDMDVQAQQMGYGRPSRWPGTTACPSPAAKDARQAALR